MSGDTLKRTPFHDLHVALKGKMVPFAGYEMPVQYPMGITKEHLAVRSGIGVFDVSHMGEFEVTGPDRNGQAQYSALLNEHGTFIDDCIVYRFDDKIMLVVNAANLEKDWEHVVARKEGVNVRVKNISDDVALLAVQGPQSEGLVQSLSQENLSEVAYYHFTVGQVAGVECFIARTGYTGEDGFELYFRPKHAEVITATISTTRSTPTRRGWAGS
jgi:aminomethyltransferase